MTLLVQGSGCILGINTIFNSYVSNLTASQAIVCSREDQIQDEQMPSIVSITKIQIKVSAPLMSDDSMSSRLILVTNQLKSSRPPATQDSENMTTYKSLRKGINKNVSDFLFGTPELNQFSKLGFELQQSKKMRRWRAKICDTSWNYLDITNGFPKKRSCYVVKFYVMSVIMVSFHVQ